MVQLSSKISGVSLWAYDQSRKPSSGQIAYALTSDQDGINPVTQTPTVKTNIADPLNYVRYVCDVNHHMNGANIQFNNIKWSTSEKDSQPVKTNSYASDEKYSPIIFRGESAYISKARNPNTGMLINPLDSDTKDPFTTDTKGIKIIDQTGIVQKNRGFAVVIFEVQQGYTIPVGANITVLPKVQNDFNGMVQDGNKYEYPVVHELTAGLFEMSITVQGDSDWLRGTKIEFNTKVDESNLPHSKVTFELSHCTVEPNDTTVTNGSHSWTFTAENGYVFDHTGGVMNPNTGMTGDEIPKTDTNITHLNNYDVQHDITIRLTAHKQQATTIPIKQNLTNVRSNVTTNEISRKLNAIQLTAETGYNFQTDIQVLFYAGSTVTSEYNVTGNNKNDITIPLNTTKDNTITDNMTNIVLTASATKIEQRAGYEHNYLITDTELNALSNEKIWNYVGGEQGEEHYNVSAYISNLVELPFKVDTQTSVERISLGRVQAHTVSHEAKSKIINLDLGVVNVPKKYNNAYDYQTQSIKLYTPFVAPITIDPVNAINQTIHIVYNVDLSNGNLTVNLYNDNVLFFTGNSNIASQLPFLNTLKNTIINRDTHFNDNDIRQPYIVVTRETPILDNDYYPTIERGLIKNYNGNVKVRLLNNMNIPNNELAELTNKLESGVKYVESN